LLVLPLIFGQCCRFAQVWKYGPHLMVLALLLPFAWGGWRLRQDWHKHLIEVLPPLDDAKVNPMHLSQR
jgi:hypothetical protein